MPAITTRLEAVSFGKDRTRICKRLGLYSGFMLSLGTKVAAIAQAAAVQPCSERTGTLPSLTVDTSLLCASGLSVMGSTTANV